VRNCNSTVAIRSVGSRDCKHAGEILLPYDGIDDCISNFTQQAAANMRHVSREVGVILLSVLAKASTTPFILEQTLDTATGSY
jgi:hypothetical protein